MNKSDILSQIKKTGLSDKEALVYSELAEIGGAYPSYIAQITKLNRSTVYKILLDLSVKGLVNEIEKKNKIFYQIGRPQKLVRLAKDQVKIANENLDNVEKILPDLEQLFDSLSNKPKVTFFDGNDTILNICNDMVSGNESYEMLAISNAKKFKNSLKLSELKSFIKSKERLGITTRAIIPDSSEDRKYNEIVLRGIDKKIWVNCRYVPQKDFPYDAEITIYGNNKVSIVKLGGEHIIGVIIEDEVIHNMMKMIFGLAWNSAKG